MNEPNMNINQESPAGAIPLREERETEGEAHKKPLPAKPTGEKKEKTKKSKPISSPGILRQ